MKQLYYEVFYSATDCLKFIQQNKIKDIIAITRNNDAKYSRVELWFRTKKIYRRPNSLGRVYF